MLLKMWFLIYILIFCYGEDIIVLYVEQTALLSELGIRLICSYSKQTFYPLDLIVVWVSKSQVV